MVLNRIDVLALGSCLHLCAFVTKLNGGNTRKVTPGYGRGTVYRP